MSLPEPGSKRRAVVSGTIAKVPGQGGLVWVVLQYVMGLRRLGWAVVIVEEIGRDDLSPEGRPFEASRNAAYFRDIVRQFGLAEQAALLLCGTRETVGLSYERVRDWSRRADLLIDMGGVLTDQDLIEDIPIRLYLDLDPGFTQLWQAVDGIDMRFEGHTHFATVGLTLGESGCRVPTCDIDWIPTLPPVVLDEWPYANGTNRDTLTTIANWRGYGSVEADGVYYGQKAHSLRRFIDLPRRTDARFELALAIDPGEPKDLQALAENGWELVDPREVADTPEAYRHFIQGSRAEFGIAKSGYVEARCGWFSDRSVCYLASGRPVIAQDTGFPAVLPIGEGLFAFESAEDVETAIDALASDYDRHRRAARAIAEEHLDSDVVLQRLLSNVGLAT